MTIEAIQQSAKIIIESMYGYETAMQRNNERKAKQTREYMLKICGNIKKLIQEERQNV